MHPKRKTTKIPEQIRDAFLVRIIPYLDNSALYAVTLTCEQFAIWSAPERHVRHLLYHEKHLNRLFQKLSIAIDWSHIETPWLQRLPSASLLNAEISVKDQMIDIQINLMSELMNEIQETYQLFCTLPLFAASYQIINDKNEQEKIKKAFDTLQLKHPIVKLVILNHTLRSKGDKDYSYSIKKYLRSLSYSILDDVKINNSPWLAIVSLSCAYQILPAEKHDQIQAELIIRFKKLFSFPESDQPDLDRLFKYILDRNNDKLNNLTGICWPSFIPTITKIITLPDLFKLWQTNTSVHNFSSSGFFNNGGTLSSDTIQNFTYFSNTEIQSSEFELRVVVFFNELPHFLKTELKESNSIFENLIALRKKSQVSDCFHRIPKFSLVDVLKIKNVIYKKLERYRSLSFSTQLWDVATLNKINTHKLNPLSENFKRPPALSIFTEHKKQKTTVNKEQEHNLEVAYCRKIRP